MVFPDPRAIFDLDRFHVPRRLAQTCRSGKFRVTFDADFSGVIRGCATSGQSPRPDVADAADDSGVYPALRIGTLP